jgi:hypothetical protein
MNYPTIEAGSPYQELLYDAFAGQQAATVRTLSDYRGMEAIHLLMEGAIARAARHTAEAVHLEPPLQQLACKKGCHHCCWATVGVVAPEVLFLAGELRRQLPPDGFSALQARSNRLRRTLRSMDRGARLEARMPCALVQGRVCSVYEARPLACRWTNSPSLQDCMDVLVRRSRVVLEMEEVRYQATQEVWQGLRAGLRDLGLDGSLLALDAALSMALSNPDAAERYIRGEPVFEEARLG